MELARNEVGRDEKRNCDEPGSNLGETAIDFQFSGVYRAGSTRYRVKIFKDLR